MKPCPRAALVGLLLPLACSDPTLAPAEDAAPAASGAGRVAHSWPSEHFPLATDMRWVYRERTGVFGGRRVVLVAETLRPVRGSPVPLFLVRESGEGTFFGIEDSGLLGFAVVEGFVVRFTAIGEDSRGELRIFGEEALRVLPLQPESGQQWEQDWHLFAVPGSRGAMRRWSSSVERLASLRVPAGRFTDVLKVEMHCWDPSLSGDRAQLSFEDYYAAGVGLIKSVSRNHEGGPWKKVVRELEVFEAPPP